MKWLLVLCGILVFSGCTTKRELGNELRVAVRDKYKTLDPADAQDHYSMIEVSRAYEPVLRYNYVKRPYVIEPALLESLPTSSKDGLVYTLKLKKGLLFQADRAFGEDSLKRGFGREVESRDVVYSYLRIADPRYTGASWWVFNEKIQGLNEWREQNRTLSKTNFDLPVAGLVVKDKYTLELRLTRKNPLLLHMLTMPYTSVVAREVVEFYGPEFRQHPVGTGPYALSAMTSNQLIWQRFEKYRSEPDPVKKDLRLPLIDKIVDDIIIEDQPAWLNFMQMNHDYLMKIPKDNSISVFDSSGSPKPELVGRGIQVHTESAADFTYIAFNMEDAVVGGVKNRFLRQAMALAYDEAPTIEKFYLGLAKKAQWLIPPGVPGHDPDYRNPNREFSLVKAREILAKAGHAGGVGIPEITYLCRSDSASRQLAEYFQRSMQALGLKVKVEPLSWPEMLARTKKKQAQVWGISWLFDYPDPENALQLLYGPNEAPGSNVANFKNPAYDALFKKYVTLPDGLERRNVLRSMRKIVETEVPWIFAVHRVETRLTHPWVSNFKIHHFEYNIEKYLSIDVAKRKAMLR